MFGIKFLKQISLIYIITGILTIPVSLGQKNGMNSSTVFSSEKMDLKYLIREPLVSSNTKKAIILLHGVGSNEADLFALSAQLPKDYYIISPRGKFTLAEGSYAWYNVDFSTGKPVYNKDQEVQSRESIRAFLKQIKVQYNLDEIFLGGFSQGAIMSFSIGLLHPTEVQGIFCLSGRILQEIRPAVSNFNEIKNLNIFLGHGTQDGTLPITFAIEAQTYLTQLKTKLSYHEYNMGHQVSEEEIRELKEWLNSIKD
jgi:phospholipase/carboxylesterase